MARCPFATYRRLSGSEPSIRPTQFIFHTAVMRDLDELEHYFEVGTDLESHFGVGGKWGNRASEDGEIRQWRDTTEQADANFHANRWPDGTGAISVETCDNGPRLAKDIEPWTPKQLDSLIRLARWAAATHNIPKRICRSPQDPGFGWHVMFPDEWTNVAGKECPGPVRINQLKTIVFPKVFAETYDPIGDLSMADAADILKRLDDLEAKLTVTGSTGLEQTTELLYGRAKAGDLQSAQALVKLDALLERPAVTADVIAAAVVAALPEGSLDVAAVTAAVEGVLNSVRLSVISS